jgi:hypothetical protein
MNESAPLLIEFTRYKDVIATIPVAITVVSSCVGFLVSYIGGERRRIGITKTLASQRATLDLLEQIARLDVERRNAGSALAGERPSLILKFATESVYSLILRDIVPDYKFKTLNKGNSVKILLVPMPKSVSAVVFTIIYYFILTTWLVVFAVYAGLFLAIKLSLTRISIAAVSLVVIGVIAFFARSRIFQLRAEHEAGLERFSAAG